jgi:hypothetical protein
VVNYSISTCQTSGLNDWGFHLTLNLGGTGAGGANSETYFGKLYESEMLDLNQLLCFLNGFFLCLACVFVENMCLCQGTCLKLMLTTFSII